MRNILPSAIYKEQAQPLSFLIDKKRLIVQMQFYIKKKIIKNTTERIKLKKFLIFVSYFLLHFQNGQ